MKIDDCKFTDQEFSGKTISELSDRPNETGMSATELKARFDLIGKTMLALGKFNKLIDFLKGTTSGDSAAEQIGSSEISELNDPVAPTQKAKTIWGQIKAITLLLFSHTNNASNPHRVTKAQVGLSEVDNTSDMNKPISIAQKAAIDLKFDATLGTQSIKGVTFNSSTGTFTFSRQNGSTFGIDTVLEKVPISCRLDGTDFVLTLEDGTDQRVSLSKFVDTYTFGDTPSIHFSKSPSSNLFTAIVPAGGITKTELAPTVMSEINALEQSARASKESAAAKAVESANSAAEAKTSQRDASSYAATAVAYANKSDASATAAKASETAASGSASSAATKATESATSATAAKASETAAANSAVAAKTSETAASGSASSAVTKASESAASAMTAKTSATAAANSATASKTSETNAGASASTATAKATEASTSAATAKASETSSGSFATSSKSYAIGGTGSRPGEDTDNSKYYMEHAKAIVGGDFATRTEAQGYVTTHDHDSASHSALFSNKVDKIQGKGLSSNDYTTADKTKLAQIEPSTYATKTEAQGYVTTHNADSAAHSVLFGQKVDKIQGKGLSTNDYTTADRTKLSQIESSATRNNINLSAAWLHASQWDKTAKTQTVNVNHVTTGSTNVIGLDASTTDDQFKAAEKARIRCISQGSGTLTLKCIGEIPTADILITVLVIW